MSPIDPKGPVGPDGKKLSEVRRLRLVEETTPWQRRERMMLWIGMLVGLGAAGVAFAYKLAEFIYTLGSDDARGFADVPITVYFVVAIGWILMLLGCWFGGQFRGVEDVKWDMLEQEEEYERRGE